MVSGVDGFSSVTVRSGPWDLTTITEFLSSTVIPIRLATSGRFPLVQSLWFTVLDGHLWCATQADSLLATRLHRNSRVGFEVAPDAPPYHGVRGTGIASVRPSQAPAILPALLDRYAIPRDSQLGAWLLSRLDSEIAVRIQPLNVTSWDYRSRM